MQYENRRKLGKVIGISIQGLVWFITIILMAFIVFAMVQALAEYSQDVVLAYSLNVSNQERYIFSMSIAILITVVIFSFLRVFLYLGTKFNSFCVKVALKWYEKKSNKFREKEGEFSTEENLEIIGIKLFKYGIISFPYFLVMFAFNTIFETQAFTPFLFIWGLGAIISMLLMEKPKVFIKTKI